jgi:DeoR/GlpR family transcriptional regulator of sugar metabolism
LIAARELRVRVVTNGLSILQELVDAEADVVAIGGALRRLTASFVGPAAVRSVRGHFADRLLMSVAGVSSTGIMTEADVLEAEVKRAMIEQSAEPVLLLDESTVAARGHQAVASVSRMPVTIVDGLSAAAISRLETAGTRVYSAQVSCDD